MGVIMHNNILYGGGSTIEPNPQESATEQLETLGIDGDVYEVTDANAIHSTDVGSANGVASLDATGRVPSTQLPSYVDDVLEYASQSAFPATGESGKIYIALDTNKTYRWSGSAYVEISQSLALGTTHQTAAYGDDAVSTAEPTYSEAITRTNLAGSGEKLSVIFGKIKKWFSDLKDLAFKAIDGANSKKYLRGDGTWQSALELQGRVYGQGDDEGLLVKYADNDWAGIALGSSNERRTYFAIKNGVTTAPVWRYHNGTVQYDAYHPAKTGTLAVTGDIPDAVAVKGDKESTYRTGNVNLTPANIGAVKSYLGWIPETSSPTAGWRRICKISYEASNGYGNGMITISGGYNVGAPSSAVVVFATMNNIATFSLLSCTNQGMIQKIRLVFNDQSGQFWLDAYLKGQSGNVSRQYFEVSGNVTITDIQKSSTIITDSVTSAAEIELGVVSGKVITSNSIGSQSVSYATTAGSATDSTRVSKSGDYMTGRLSIIENSVALNLRPNNQDYYTTVSYQTAGNEALVFATKMGVTSFMFVNGEDSETHHENNRWQSLTPALQIKNNKIAINKLIANNANLTYPLEVNGDVQATNFRGALIGTADKATKDGDGNTISSTYAKKTDIATFEADGSAGTGTGYRRIALINITTPGKYLVTAWMSTNGSGRKGIAISNSSNSNYRASWNSDNVDTSYPITMTCIDVITVSSTLYLQARAYNTNSSTTGEPGGIYAVKIS